MEIKLDLHTHTSFSPHAYSTLMENITVAAEKGLEAIAMTNHGPSTKDFSHEWHFANYVAIPREVKGVVVFKGVEATYTDIDGNLDMSDEQLKKMDVVIASGHSAFVCDETNYVETLLNVMKNPYVDILGHIARTKFTLTDEEYGIIAKAAKENSKLVELNSSCFAKKKDVFYKNSKKLMLACKEWRTPIAVNTDAHFCTFVGEFGEPLKLLDEIGFEEHLVINTSLKKFMGYICKKKNIDI